MYCLRKVRSSVANLDMLVTLYNAVRYSLIMFGSVCWGGDIAKLDRGGLGELLKTNCRSCCGKTTGQF